MLKADKKDLENIPGVGPAIAKGLEALGYYHVSDLSGCDPERMYKKLCDLRSAHIDKCVLYVFRCAVYFASNEKHDPLLLKWWNWKERKDLSAR